MKLIYLFSFLSFFLIACAYSTGDKPSASESSYTVEPADSQLDFYLPYLKNKRVALVVNQSSVVNGVHLCDTLVSRGIDVVRIFAPEHGFRGVADAGEHVRDDIDSRTGIEIVSLYGKNKKPSPEKLSDVDIVVYDLQDVGVRFYTYISTLHYVMDVCSTCDVELLVLDRPNPNGDYIDGPVLESSCRSFVGIDPIPIVYGLTPAELALMINGEKWLESGLRCRLKVVKMAHYSHSDRYELPVNPSPNLKSYNAIRHYPSLCFFEATNVSVGRGTSFPFEVAGAPDSTLGSFSFIPVSMPGAKSPLHQNKSCYGLDLRSTVASHYVDLSCFVDFRAKMGDSFWLNPSFFDLLAGNKTLRIQIDQGLSEDSIRSTWQPAIEEYKVLRQKYLLYDVPDVNVEPIDWNKLSHSSWVDSVYNSMTEEERIAQLIWITLDVNADEQQIARTCNIINKYHVGGLLIMQTPLANIPDLVLRFSSNSKYPLMFAADAENGLAMKVSEAVDYPLNISLGAVQNDSLLYLMGQNIGRQLRSCGMHVDFGPVVDVNTNPNNPIIGKRSLGENQNSVARKGVALMQGIQSVGCIAVAKHFPGHGDTETDSHHVLPLVPHSRERLDSVELMPFRSLVDSGVMGVMSAHLAVPHLNAPSASSLSPYVLDSLLRNEMRFNGLVFSDAMNMKSVIIAAKGENVEALALQSGNDVAEFCVDVPKAISSVSTIINQNKISRQYLEEKVRRLLAAKLWCGLDHPNVPYPDAFSSVNSLEAELLADELFRSSITALDTTNLGREIGKVTCLGKWKTEKLHSLNSSSPVELLLVDDHSVKQAISLLSSRKSTSNIIIAYSGNPYRLTDFSRFHCGLVVVYENTSRSHRVLSDFFYGGGVATGRMPVSASVYKVGQGFNFERKK